MSVLVIVGAILAVFLTVFAAMATYSVVADDGMMDGMWDMMGDMGDMGSMHGMMGGGGPETTGSASGAGDVLIEDFRFEPTVLTVTPGTVITWTNEDSAPHTATSEEFDTGRLDKGEAAEITFDTIGEFDYICTYHPQMEGRIVVSATSAR